MDNSSNIVDAIRVLIVDDQDIVRESIGALLDLFNEIDVVGSCVNGKEAIKFLEERNDDVDVMILDIQMEGMSGIEVTKKVKASYKNVCVLVLTGHREFGEMAMKAGADGFVAKNSGSGDLLEAIINVAHGTKFFRGGVDATTLSERDIQILGLLSKGMSTNDVAQELKLSYHTVERYLSLMYPKINAYDRVHAVAIALRRGLIS